MYDYKQDQLEIMSDMMDELNKVLEEEQKIMLTAVNNIEYTSSNIFDANGIEVS